MDAWKLKQDIDEDILYWIGQAYHHSEKFDSAIEYFLLRAYQLGQSWGLLPFRNCQTNNSATNFCKEHELRYRNGFNYAKGTGI